MSAGSSVEGVPPKSVNCASARATRLAEGCIPSMVLEAKLSDRSSTHIAGDKVSVDFWSNV